MHGPGRLRKTLRVAVSAAVVALLACVWLAWRALQSPTADLPSGRVEFAFALLVLLAAATLLAYAARALLAGARRDTEVRLEGIVDSVPDAIISIDAGQRVVLFNAAAERIFEIDAATALGQPLERFIPQRFRKAHATHVQRFQETGATKRRMGALGALSGLRSSGEEFPIEASISQAVVSGERVLTVVLRDISERTRVESELQATQMKLAHIARLSTMGEMASGLSHEINQPLTAIATYAQALENLLRAEQAPDRDEMRDALRQISGQALRAGEVIRRLRTMIKEREPDFRTLDCEDLLNDVFALAEIDARLHRVTLRTAGNCRGASIRGDAVQLQQVLINLVRNSMDALDDLPPERRTVTIAVNAADGVAEFRVIDHGKGVPSEVLDKMFSPFFTTKPHGTGLGLAISRSIVEAHRGRLRHESTPGGGATFSFTVPVEIAQVA
jgi:two-component system, LuxR family, sensor kinase FixL